jgi:hypothetical protein
MLKNYEFKTEKNFSQNTQLKNSLLLVMSTGQEISTAWSGNSHSREKRLLASLLPSVRLCITE